MSAERFVQAARAMLGARWRHRGRKPWAVDCLGLVVLAGERAGLQIDGIPKVYGREPWDDSLRSGLAERFGAPVRDGRPGDVALIRWRKGEPSHVAVIGDHPTAGLSLIHAHNIRGVVEHALAPPFTECVVEIYRPWRDTSSL